MNTENTKEVEANDATASELKRLLGRSLRAICLTRDYVGSEILPPIEGWEWFDAGKEISELIPEHEWADEFWSRVHESNNPKPIKDVKECDPA